MRRIYTRRCIAGCKNLYVACALLIRIDANEALVVKRKPAGGQPWGRISAYRQQGRIAGEPPTAAQGQLVSLKTLARVL